MGLQKCSEIYVENRKNPAFGAGLEKKEKYLLVYKQLKSFAVNINDLNFRIIFEVFTQFCDVNIHTPAVKIIIVPFSSLGHPV